MKTKTPSTPINSRLELPTLFPARPELMMPRAAGVVNRSLSLVLNILKNTGKLVDDIVRDSLDLSREAEALYAMARERAAALSPAIRSTPRFARIFGELTRMVVDYRIQALKSRFLSPTASARTLEALHRKNAERIYNLCVEMRGGLIKIGQFASTYMNILPPVYAEYLSLLQDKVPPFPFEAIARRIETELGRPIADVFAGIDPEPLAAASIAQVHAAELLDGTTVVVKVQTPDIEQTVEIDLTAFTIVADIMNDLFPQLGLSGISRALAEAVREELDYGRELENIRDFRKQLVDNPCLAVPEVYPQASTRRLLTMERLTGQGLIPFLETASPERRNRFLGLIAKSFCAQIVSHGFFHADPHPGNIIVLADDRLGLIDFGCVERFSPEIYALYARMIAAILSRNVDEMTRLFSDMGFAGDTEQTETLRQMATDFMELLMLSPDQNLADADLSQKISRALELLRKYPSVRVPRHFVLLGRTLLTLGGIMMRYNPDINIFLLMAGHLAGASA